VRLRLTTRRDDAIVVPVRNAPRKILGMLALGSAVALAAASGAGAAGSASISGAPIVRAGVQETGNTMTDSTGDGSIGSDLSPGCWNDVEYWRLPLTAGDEVVLSGKTTPPAYHFQVGFFPAGTTDRNIDKEVAVVSGFPGRAPIHFAAHSTGTYALVFGPGCYNGSDGPYTFTVSVTRH